MSSEAVVRLYKDALPIVRALERQMAAVAQHDDAIVDEPLGQGFDGWLERLRKGIAALDSTTSEIESFDFYDAVQEASDRLRVLSDLPETERVREFVDHLRGRLAVAVRDWVCVVAVDNLSLPRSPKQRRQRLGRFELNPELGPGTIARCALRFRALLTRHGVEVQNQRYEFTTSMFEHMNRKFRGALSNRPLLVFPMRGSDHAWVHAARLLDTLRASLIANVPVYGSMPRQYDGIRFRSATEKKPITGWMLRVDQRTGFFSHVPLGDETRLPGCALDLAGKRRMRAESLIELLNPVAMRVAGKDGLRARLHQMATFMRQADETRERHLQLLYAVIGLECMVKSTNEIQLRLSQNVASLLTRSPANRNQIAGIVRDVYHARSKFVHEGSMPPMGDPMKDDAQSVFDDDDLVRQSRWLLRGTFNAVVDAYATLRTSVEPSKLDETFQSELSAALSGARPVWQRVRRR